MGTTAKEVADLAGVSLSTVSRALAGAEYVSIKTRDRVMDAALTLGYVPNAAPPAPVPVSAGKIGFVLPDLSNPYLVGLAKAILARARQHDQSVLILDTDEDQEHEFAMVQSMATQADGLILCSPRMSDAELKISAEPDKIVLVNRECDGISSVSGDLKAGYYDAVKHLSALGHSKIAYVSGWRTSRSGGQRIQGLHMAAEELGIDIIEAGNFAPDHEGGYTAADLVLASGATAVICYNDMMAIGMMSRLQDRGIHIPAQMSVIGCDNIIFSKMSTPSLTSIAVSNISTGGAAVDLLTKQLANPDFPTSHISINARLIVRNSIAEPRIV